MYNLRNDVATPHDAIEPALEGVTKAIAKCPETRTSRRRRLVVVGATLTKAEAMAAYSAVVAEVVTKAAASDSVTEDNIEDTMEAITSDAASKTAYFVDEFDGVEVADLAAFSQATSEAVASKVMEMDSKSKVKSMKKMKKIHRACGKGGARGMGKNKYLKTSGGLLSGAISKWSKGCSKGINKGSRKAKHPGFSGTSKKNKAKWMQQFNSGSGSGCVKGALGIDVPSFGASDLGDAYKGILTAQTTEAGGMAASNDYFDSDDLAEGAGASTADCAGALGGGDGFKGVPLTPTQLGDFIAGGTEGPLFISFVCLPLFFSFVSSLLSCISFVRRCCGRPRDDRTRGRHRL